MLISIVFMNLIIVFIQSSKKIYLFYFSIVNIIHIENEKKNKKLYIADLSMNRFSVYEELIGCDLRVYL